MWGLDLFIHLQTSIFKILMVSATVFHKFLFRIYVKIIHCSLRLFHLQKQQHSSQGWNMRRNLISKDAAYNWEIYQSQLDVISFSEMAKIWNRFTFCYKNYFFPIYYIWKKNLVASLIYLWEEKNCEQYTNRIFNTSIFLNTSTLK